MSQTNNTQSQEKPKEAPKVDKASLAQSIKTHETAKNTNTTVKK
jgi:hypothetical protein